MPGHTYNELGHRSVKALTIRIRHATAAVAVTVHVGPSADACIVWLPSDAQKGTPE